MQTPNGKNAPSTTTEKHIAKERAGISDSQRQSGDRPMTKTEMKKPLPTSQVSKANKVSTEEYKSPIDDRNKNNAKKTDSARDNREKDNRQQNKRQNYRELQKRTRQP
jgi:hypothetical protein